MVSGRDSAGSSGGRSSSRGTSAMSKLSRSVAVSRSILAGSSARPSTSRWVGKIVRPSSSSATRHMSTYRCAPSPPSSSAWTRAVS